MNFFPVLVICNWFLLQRFEVSLDEVVAPTKEQTLAAALFSGIEPIIPAGLHLNEVAHVIFIELSGSGKLISY